MKFQKLFAGMLASVAVASALGTTTASAASSKRLNGVWWTGQQENYWCGYAALRSAVNNEYQIKNLKSGYRYFWSQKDIADHMQNNYGMHPYDNYYYDGSCAWYTGSSNTTDTNQDNYPVGRMLTKITSAFTWVAYGCCTTGNNQLSSSEVKWRLKSTINSNHSVLACGRSNSNGSSYMPNYPTGYFEHWIATDGYTNDGDTVCVVDPAAQGCGGSGFGNVQKYYNVSIKKFTDFAWYHGLIW